MASSTGCSSNGSGSNSMGLTKLEDCLYCPAKGVNRTHVLNQHYFNLFRCLICKNNGNKDLFFTHDAEPMSLHLKESHDLHYLLPLDVGAIAAGFVSGPADLRRIRCKWCEVKLLSQGSGAFKDHFVKEHKLENYREQEMDWFCRICDRILDNEEEALEHREHR